MPLTLPIPIVCLAYHDVRIIIDTSRPIKYIDIIYNLFTAGRDKLAMGQWMMYYSLANKKIIPLLIMSGMAGVPGNSCYESTVPNCVVSIQKIWKAKMKLKKLKMFREMKEIADIILYKPGNLGFLELNEKYKTIFTG